MLTELSFQVLLAISSGASHGYAIGKYIEEHSRGRLDPTTGAVYQALKRLTEEGLIRQAAAPADETDERRRYFAITARGRRATEAEIHRLEQLVVRARQQYPREAKAQ